MPAYDYHCEKCGVTQEYFLRPMPPNKLLCATPDCGGEADYAPSFYYTSQTAQRFAPVVVHKDAEGNVRFPGHADAPLPPGFHRVELTDFYQIRKFEKEVNQRDKERASKFHEAKSFLLDGQLKENRRVMNELVKNFTPRGKAFYDKMREVSERKQKTSGRPIDPGFYIEAFTQDSSNRQGYRDAKNDWGRHQGSGK
jgi:hypothetical protein